MVSFDVVSVFTKVPIKEIMNLLGCHFEEDILGLFLHVLTTSYFTYNRQFYGQIDGVDVGALLSSVTANFYMEDEKVVLELATLKPDCWFYYVDDTFVICPHGSNKLKDFLHHLNNIHQSIQFTMKTESEGHLPHISISTSMSSPIITHPINKWYYLVWCTGPKLSVMRTACRPSLCS
jgi:hypothetical protein